MLKTREQVREAEKMRHFAHTEQKKKLSALTRFVNGCSFLNIFDII